jgi:hypothetical protein
VDQQVARQLGQVSRVPAGPQQESPLQVSRESADPPMASHHLVRARPVVAQVRQQADQVASQLASPRAGQPGNLVASLLVDRVRSLPASQLAAVVVTRGVQPEADLVHT